MIVATNQWGGPWDGSGSDRPQLPTAHLDVRMGGDRSVLLRPKRIEIISEVGAGTVFASFSRRSLGLANQEAYCRIVFIVQKWITVSSFVYMY